MTSRNRIAQLQRQPTNGTAVRITNTTDDALVELSFPYDWIIFRSKFKRRFKIVAPRVRPM